MKLIEGERHQRRPSSIARKAGFRYSTEVLVADRFEVPGESWLGEERMPNESDSADLGWCPGPIDRELPEFKGPKPGPTNAELHQYSSEVTIMRDLITDRFKKRCQQLTAQHVEMFRKTHPNRGRKSIERAFGTEEGFLALTDDGLARFSSLFDTWLAAKLRIAQLKPEVPAKALWGLIPEARCLYDNELDTVLTYRQFQFCNRHMSFADALDAGTVTPPL